MKQNNDNFDWFEWAGLKPTQYDDLVDEAKRQGVPVFEEDKKEDIFNRLLAVKSFKNNKSTVNINKILTAITFVSAVVTVITAFFK